MHIATSSAIPSRDRLASLRHNDDEIDSMGQWIFGAIMGVLSLFGLFIASRSHDQIFYAFGLLLFLFGLGFVFWLIARNTGHPRSRSEQHGH